MESQKKELRQYSKRIVTALFLCSVLWVSASYGMAFYALIFQDNVDTVSSVTEKVVDMLKVVFGCYFVKSFLETYAEKKNELYLQTLDDDTIEDNLDTDDMGDNAQDVG